MNETTTLMRSKVFKNEEVLILENEINSWLNINSDIEVVDTAVADNQFIILYNQSKTAKIDKAIEVVRGMQDDIKDMKDNPIEGKGIHAPHISEYYKKDQGQ